MIIKEKTNDVFVPYHGLQPGTVFRYCKNLYLATNEFYFDVVGGTEKVNGVNLKNGNFVYVPYDEKVEIVKGYFQIE